MSELKLPRLLAAAKEFNIGQDTLVDFLAKKGFNKDDLKPTAKLTEQQYLALQTEFQGDKVAKNKADQVEIPKSIGAEARKKKEEDDLSFKKEEKKVVAPKEETKPAEVVVPTPEPVQEVVVEQPAPVIEATPEPVIPVEVEAPQPQPIVEAKAPEETVTKLDAPSIEGPKILDKIDLSAIDSSTRPKKGAKKTIEPVKPSAPKVEVKKTVEPVTPPATIQIVEPVTPVEDAPPVIENIEVEKLTGPKILGKISLPVDNDTRPKPGAKDEHRKRKRIIVDKKTSGNIQHVDFRKDDKTGGGTQQPRLGIQKAGPGGAPNRGGGPGGQNRGGGPNRGGGNRNDRGRDVRREDKEIDAKEIQDKIKETQAKLAGGGGRGKSLKAKYRREKRQEAADAADGMMGDDNKLHVTEFVTVSELANLMDVSFTDVISKCM
nr:translation initiation factor IF-2 [Chitinophagaceae bacterium]